MLIAHRCTKCSHPDYRRRETDPDGGRGPCDCGCRCDLGPSEALPTFDVAGRKVERFIKPGGKFGRGVDNGLGNTNGFGVVTCNCDACKALYERLTTVGSVPEPPSTAGPSPRQLRKWAAEVGVDCPPRGRIPASVVEAYAAAHSN